MKPTLILTTLLLAPLAALQAADSRSNILFLFTDDQTSGAMGCYGNRDIITPHMDQLAGDGVRFRNHYNSTSICMASRASVMTGLHEYRHGCNFSHGDLERRLFDQSYPVKLRQAVYFTGFAGKVGFLLNGEKFEAFEKEFDLWAGGPGQTHYETEKNKGIAQCADQYPHSSRACGAWAQDFMKRAKQSGKPFCLSISFKAPHLPFTPDPIDLKLYETREWKYTHWYYAGRLKPDAPALMPTEELFHLAGDRLEMHNLAADPHFTPQLAAARAAYDAELAVMKERSSRVMVMKPTPSCLTAQRPGRQRCRS